MSSVYTSTLRPRNQSDHHTANPPLKGPSNVKNRVSDNQQQPKHRDIATLGYPPVKLQGQGQRAQQHSNNTATQQQQNKKKLLERVQGPHRRPATKRTGTLYSVRYTLGTKGRKAQPDKITPPTRGREKKSKSARDQQLQESTSYKHATKQWRQGLSPCPGCQSGGCWDWWWRSCC